MVLGRIVACRRAQIRKQPRKFAPRLRMQPGARSCARRRAKRMQPGPKGSALGPARPRSTSAPAPSASAQSSTGGFADAALAENATLAPLLGVA